MLFRLEIENFYSIADRQEIDFCLRVPDDPRFAPIYPNAKKRAPKVVAVFGPNASGKTVFLRAISFLAWFATDSFQLPPYQPLPDFQFKNEHWAKKPTRLAVEIGQRSLFPGREGEAGVYRYEVEIQGQKESLPSSVTKESLSYKPSTARKPLLVFERGDDGRIQGTDLFPILSLPSVFKIRPNTSVISTYAQLGHQITIEFQKVLQGIRYNLFWYKEALSLERLILLFRQDPELLKQANRELRRLDLGLLELKISQNGELIFTHQGLKESIPWVLESNGTQSFLRSFPHLWMVLKTGGIAVIDELDASIHPDVLREIISWFWDPEKNPSGAQLFFSCHTIHLLEELKKEEILFCEKTPKEGYTRMYRLADIEGISDSEDFVRGYRQGVYGALPNIG